MGSEGRKDWATSGGKRNWQLGLAMRVASQEIVLWVVLALWVTPGEAKAMSSSATCASRVP